MHESPTFTFLLSVGRSPSGGGLDVPVMVSGRCLRRSRQLLALRLSLGGSARGLSLIGLSLGAAASA